MTDDTAGNRLLITGATGFIGRQLCAIARNRGFFVRAAVRKITDDPGGNYPLVAVGDIGPDTDWKKALAGIDVVIHLAGRAHMVHSGGADELAVCRHINVAGTQRLAQSAAQAGVKKFIFLSSVKVNGEGSCNPYRETDKAFPQDAYALSKLEAEELLARITVETGMQTVILRPPLVYGPGVKANFKHLIKIAGCGLPLPFKNINNKRSFIYVGNLADAILACIKHPLAASETFMVSDTESLSISDLIRLLAGTMNRKLMLFPMHPAVLKALCAIVGKGQEIEKLTGTLLVDSGKIRHVIGWQPPFSMRQGITETIKSYSI